MVTKIPPVPNPYIGAPNDIGYCNKCGVYNDDNTCECRGNTLSLIYKEPKVTTKLVDLPDDMVPIPKELHTKLTTLGIIDSEVRGGNVGASDYSKHIIQPWSIWLDYKLNPWDADIIKRILRTKETDTRTLDYEKVIHICQERIRQLGEQE